MNAIVDRPRRDLTSFLHFFFWHTVLGFFFLTRSQAEITKVSYKRMYNMRT